MNVRTVSATLIIAAFVLLPALPARAGAADRQSVFISGQLGFNYYLKGDTPEGSPTEGLDLLFAPRVLYFPVRGLGLGGELNLSAYANSYKRTGLAVGPRIAYYIKPDASYYARGCCLTPWFGSRSYWMPFVGLSLMYLLDQASYSGVSSSASGYRGRVGIGAAPLIGDHGTTFLELGFQTQTLKYESVSRTSNKLYLEGGFGAFLFK